MPSSTITVPPRTDHGHRHVEGLPTVGLVVAVAGVLAAVAVALRWQGSDLPAQVFRAELFRRDGFVLWNSQWFGGHAALGYSVITPPLMGHVGPIALAAVSGVASAFVFERVLRHAFGPVAWLGSLWFALATVTNLIVGRTTYAFGVALGLAAIYALQRRHTVLAAIAATLCSLASPLAGGFLAVFAFAWAASARERRAHALAVFAGAALPLATVTLLFPTPGHEPYELWALLVDLALSISIAVLLRQYPLARWGAACFAILAVASYLVPSALGGNVSRLDQYVAGPLLACALLPRRRVLLALVAIPLLIWQWFPAVDGIAFARTDPSTRESYYQPVLSFVARQAGPIGRVEIPSTYRHWEAAYAAPHVALARGWERQLDIAYNPIFYSEPLTADSYGAWLHENGVKFVALPDAQLDDSSLAEKDLLLRGLPYLHEVWHDAHWRVWRVDGFSGLAQGPATLQSMSPDRVMLRVSGPGDVLLRVRSTSHWSVHPEGCAASNDDGWTVLRDLPTGTVTLRQSLTGTPCPG